MSAPKLEYRVVWRRGQPPWRGQDVNGHDLPPLSDSERTRRRIFQSEKAAVAHVERLRTAKADFEAMGREEGQRGIEVAELEYIRVDLRPVGDWERGAVVNS